jgi:hypothetical protein
MKRLDMISSIKKNVFQNNACVRKAKDLSHKLDSSPWESSDVVVGC